MNDDLKFVAGLALVVVVIAAFLLLGDRSAEIDWNAVNANALPPINP